MKEIITDLRSLESEDNPEGEPLVDHGIVQQLEAVLLDNAGSVLRIKITKVRNIKWLS